MKKFIRNVIVMAMSIFFVGFIGTNIALAATTPSLGTASTFSALAHIFTSTTIPYGASLFGDLGYATTTGVSAYVSGTTYINNATYLQAGIDQHTALSALNSQPCTFTFNNAVDLTNDISHGPLGIYVPGVYCSLGAMSIGSGGTITLDGTGTYIFRPAGTLITSDLSSVITTNGASACDIFWTPQTPPALASTILGSDTKFVGTVIEPVGPVNSDITIGGGTHWIGRALAFDWSVKTNPIIMKYVTITVPTCPVPPPPPPPPPPHIPETVTLHIIKHVVNNNGGTAIASSFILHVKGSSSMGIGDVV